MYDDANVEIEQHSDRVCVRDGKRERARKRLCALAKSIPKYFHKAFLFCVYLIM